MNMAVEILGSEPNGPSGQNGGKAIACLKQSSVTDHSAVFIELAECK
jgi:hypothetical protein